MTVLDQALTYLRSGVSVIPVRRGGSKAPTVPWAPYQDEPPTEAQARAWWGVRVPPGIAAVCGAVSGGLEVIDFDRDAGELYPRWCDAVRAAWPGLIDRVCVHRTPRPGYHAWLRCGNIETPGNTKLASSPEGVLIETRGEGGYALLPGSPPECHENNDVYAHVAGPTLDRLPDLSIDERDFLVACARGLDRSRPALEVAVPAEGLRPGEDFDRRGPDWAEILAPAGWTVAVEAGQERWWRRPGKAAGWSATTGHCTAADGADLLRVFSSNASPFEEGRAYGKFRAYAMLHHAGDVPAAARALRALGFGGADTTSDKTSRAREKPRAPEVLSVLAFVNRVPRPVSTEPYAPFPAGHLPHPVRDFCLAGAEALGCDVAYLALPALSVVAGVIGSSLAISLKRTWEEPAVIWTAVVGESGTLKTPAYKMALAPVWDMQHQMVARGKQDVAEWRAQMKEAKANGQGGDFDKPRPVQKRVIASDTTIERLAELLEDNPRGIIVARDELAGWLGSFSRYKAKGAGSDLPNWLEMSSGGAISVDRKTGDRKYVFIPRACVSVAGGIQWGTLARALTPDYFEAGLTARILLAWPDRKRKAWTDAELPDRVREDYRQVVERLYVVQPATLPSGAAAPHRVPLSPAARRLWVGFYEEWAADQADAEGEVASALSKLEGYAARLALVHHAATQAAGGLDPAAPIPEASVAAGIALARWFAAEARRIYAHLSESEEQRELRHLLRWLGHRGGRATARDLYRANPRRYPQPEAAEAALDALVQAGMGRWVEAPPGPQGGRPKRHFETEMTKAKTAKTPPEGEVDWSEGDDTTSDKTP